MLEWMHPGMYRVPGGSAALYSDPKLYVATIHVNKVLECTREKAKDVPAGHRGDQEVAWETVGDDDTGTTSSRCEVPLYDGANL